jgi:large subunit ribosomal protein L4
LHNLKAEGSTLILLPDSDINVIKSAANIPGVHTLPVEDVNVVAALKHRYLVMPVAAVRRLESLLGADDQAPATVE